MTASRAMLMAAAGVSTGGGFSPSDISGLQWWLDASTISGSDGDAIGTWSDQSGNSRNATQATGFKQPLLKKAANGIGGKNVLLFDGSNDELRTGSFTLAQPDTFFVVAKASNTTGLKIHFNGITSRQQVWQDDTDLDYYAGTVVTTFVSLGSAAHIISVIFNGASSRARIDGTSASTGNPGSNSITGGVMIGTDGTSFYGGSIAEIVAYDSSLSDTDHNSVGQYLADKYGLTWNTI